MILAVFGYRANNAFREFCEYIEKRHPALWELIGRPNMSLPALVVYKNRLKLIAFMRFLWQKRYVDVSDPVARAFCARLRTQGAVLLCCLLVLIILPVLGMSFFGMR